SVPEILSHPHLTERQFVSSFDCAAGKQTVTRGGFTFSDNSAGPTTPAPRLSEHTEEWLRKLGYASEIRALRNDGVI
ncbi:MAG TPA: hypothetical protein VFI95_21850, partial [Terriglobales bacterium]|nr:hypothetical protein [Terriglobales bacterium]